MQYSIPPDLMRKPWSHEDKMKLIELAEKYDVLWNTTYPFYRELTQRKKALEEIKESLDNRHSVEDINSQWRNLKDVFYKKQTVMEQKEVMGEAPGEPVWRYYQPLKFLLTCEEERKNILRKRFHGNYELAQLRQLRLRRTQAISSENRNHSTTSSHSNNWNNQCADSYNVLPNNVVLNALKGRLKMENLEGFKNSMGNRKGSFENINLDRNVSASPPSTYGSFNSDRIKRELQEGDESMETGNGVDLYSEDSQNNFDNSDTPKEAPLMSVNDELLAAVSAASTSAESVFDQSSKSSSVETPKNSSSKVAFSTMDDSSEKFKYFSTYVESALLDINQQSPTIARRLVQEIYASIAKHQGQLMFEK